MQQVCPGTPSVPSHCHDNYDWHLCFKTLTQNINIMDVFISKLYILSVVTVTSKSKIDLLSSNY